MSISNAGLSPTPRLQNWNGIMRWSFSINFILSHHKLTFSYLPGAPTTPQCIRRYPPLQSVPRYPGNFPSEKSSNALAGAESQNINDGNSELQGVEKKHNGAYTCRAENSQGEATSNTINLSIKCKYSAVQSQLYNWHFQTDLCATTRPWRTAR